VIEQLGGDPSKTALGNCTMNAAYGLLMTEPFHQSGWVFTEDDCVRGYAQETRLDDAQIPGEWPPTDTGSSGPFAMQTLQAEGLITDWVHSRSFHAVLRLLMHGPVALGITWFQSMFTPDGSDTLVVDPESGVAGGHEIEARALDVAGQRVKLTNSWGAGWGDQGEVWLAWHDLDFLLSIGGDAVQPAE
jgi:hypothetical protein